MAVNPGHCVKVYVFIFVIIMAVISYNIFCKVSLLTQQRIQTQNVTDPSKRIARAAEVNVNVHRKREIEYKITTSVLMREINEKQKIYNTDILGPLDAYTQIIIIQVNSDLNSLKQLLISLEAAEYITDALLIFSHNFYDKDINSIIHHIYYAKYMQIFYPFSIQMYPNEYPGPEYNCVNDVCKQIKNRDPVSAQKKLHWWWQLNQVFDHLQVTKNYTKNILILEDNNYVTTDFLLTLKKLENVVDLKIPGQKMISLSMTYGAETSNSLEDSKVIVSTWADKIPHFGIGFNKVTWKFIKSYSCEFCHYNDYTWYNTLRYIGTKTKDTYLFSDTKGPKVLRIDKCETCTTGDKAMIKYFINKLNRSAYFPPFDNTYIEVKPLGQFNDIRDQEFCMSFTRNSFW